MEDNDSDCDVEQCVPAPSEFMRGRRPALYSDSLAVSIAPLSRDAFEYRLETITARSEEAQFQRLVHALLEVEVCPNLIPQTGPSGGGDSKVDTETYAVADAIVERWWSGTAREAANESWAFAISAMKDWRKKARRDIDNVLASGRTYHRIYFVTNQFVKDRDRANLEKQLTRRAGDISVRIFDRTWILQAVFDHGHWAIAERELGLPAATAKPLGTIGPLDADRARQLAQVEAEIANPMRFSNSPVQLAHAWLTSALLARGLGRAREEVDQRFDRAVEASRRGKAARAQRRMLYQKTWTAFWWFDDYGSVIGGYNAIEALLDDDTNAWDLEQLTNLYTLLYTAERQEWLPAGAASLRARGNRLRDQLQQLANRRSHPTDAAWARTHLLLLNFLADPTNPEQHGETVEGFQVLLREVERLPEYPVESLCNVISVFSKFPIVIEGIEAVADHAGELVGQRVGAQAQARQLLDRAAHKIEAKAAEDALRLLGRAVRLLHRQPSNDLYLEGAWIAAQAYCEVGLFCAARAHLLLGLSRSLRSIVEDAQFSEESLSFALRLAWVELAAGRLSLMLEALHYADAIAAALDLSDRGKAAYWEERQNLEFLLSRSIASSKVDDAPAIGVAAVMLYERQLPVAQQAALAVLGHPQDEMGALTGGMDLAALQAIPWPEGVGPIDWESTMVGTIRSRILGCEIVVSGIATHEARSLGMTFLATLEGFAATAFVDRLTPGNDRLMIEIDDSQEAKALAVSFDEDECGDPVIRLAFARGTLFECAQTKDFHERSLDAVVRIIGHVCAPTDRSTLERMFSQDAVHDRAFGLLNACALDDTSPQSSSLAALMPLGQSPAELLHGGQFQPRTAEKTGSGMWKAEIATGPRPPLERRFHHRHTQLAGAINSPLWNRAGWLGLGFTHWDDGVPGVSLMFKDADAAAKILRGWHRRVEGRNADQILRLAILTHVDKNNLGHYRVGIAPAEAGPMPEATHTVIIAVRVNTMTPDDTQNLDGFLKAFAQHGRFRISVAVVSIDSHDPQMIAIAPIELTQLAIKPAWQISGSEPLFAMMLRAEDDPYIPAEVAASEDLPLLQLIADRRKRGPMRWADGH